MTTTPAIEIAGLTKSYGDHAVLRGVDLSVPAGTIFALLGSNGAGKTTAVRILSTLLKADGGTAAVNGYDVATQPAPSARRSASPGSSPPSTRSSPDGRTSCSSPSCGASTDPGGIADDLLAGSRSPTRRAAGWRRTPAACAAASTSR